MKKRRFIAGVIDRVCIILLFIALVFIYGGPYASSGLLGKYQAIAFGTSPSIYAYMNYSTHSNYSDSVDTYYTDESNRASDTLGISSYQELDNVMTLIFVGANLIYFLVVGIFLKSSFGETMCGLVTYDRVDNLAGVYEILIRVIVYGIILYLFVGLRYIFDTTYLKISLLFLLLNWCLIFYKGKSLVDVMSFSHLKKYNHADNT